MAVGGDGVKIAIEAELLLLHPELLSGPFILQLLQQRNIAIESLKDAEKDRIVEVYIQHVIPLPQRELPKNRWGRMMSEKRGQQTGSTTQSKRSLMDGSRKRPLIVFDGSSTSTNIKLKKNENGMGDQMKGIMNTSTKDKLAQSPRDTQILTDNNAVKSPSSATPNNGTTTMKYEDNMPLKTSPLLSSASPGGTNVIKLKRAIGKDGEGDPPEEPTSPGPKKKIQHITWP
ncbi:ashwin isoform X2 [Callorhinchus milii]|uniref:Ashwin n=1 Tax=Callorhinchus milii TaxID=7868 RepID=A0A4W3JFQ3_CALMI|nr:ashwin isoform X2 [Callorhinchus milii]|eukprot:gi/632939832/ref/XP_007883292.1/ PREDICTED: ashwin isoform X2 [Callorhinchus milii]